MSECSDLLCFALLLFFSGTGTRGRCFNLLIRGPGRPCSPPKEWHSGRAPRTGVSLFPNPYPAAGGSLYHLDPRPGCGSGRLIPSSPRFPVGPSASCGTGRRGVTLQVACASSVAIRVLASGPLRHRRGVKSRRERNVCLRQIVPGRSPEGRPPDGPVGETLPGRARGVVPRCCRREWDGGA